MMANMALYLGCLMLLRTLKGFKKQQKMFMQLFRRPETRSDSNLVFVSVLPQPPPCGYVSEEHYDVTVKLTFERLDIKHHHFLILVL